MSDSKEYTRFLDETIARELLSEQVGPVSEADFQEAYSKCGGNPFNVVIMYRLIEQDKKDNVQV